MSSRASRARATIAAALLTPLFALCLALPGAPHGGHDGPFDRECLACRWAVHDAAEIDVPVSLPKPFARTGSTPAPAMAREADGACSTRSSRGPPPADA